MMTAEEFIVSKMKDTEIGIFVGRESFTKYDLVIFDVETQKTRVLTEMGGGIQTKLLKTAPVSFSIAQASFNRYGKLPNEANILGEKIALVQNSVSYDDVTKKHKRHAAIGYAAANFVHSLESEGLNPVEVVKKAHKDYWDIHDESDKFEGEVPFVKEYRLKPSWLKDYYDEAMSALSVRKERFIEDILDKWQRGSRFCLGVEPEDFLPFDEESADEASLAYICECTPGTQHLDRYIIDKELFEAAKEVLPYYGYIDENEDYRRFYAAINSGESICISEITSVISDRKNQSLMLGSIEAAKLLNDIGIVDDDISKSIIEYAEGIEAPNFEEMYECLYYLYINHKAQTEPCAEIGDYIREELKVRPAARETAEKEGTFLDISENSLFKEFKREQEGRGL